MQRLRFWAPLLLVFASVCGYAQVPFISQPLVPDAVAPGGAAFTLTLHGVGFTASSVVYWDGGARSTMFLDSTTLSATINAADIASAGTASVTVANASSGAVSNIVFFPVTLPTGSVAMAPFNIATPSGPEVVAVGDFNGDGKLDMAVTSYFSDVVSVFLGNGDGSFQTGVSYTVGANPSSVVVGDFNGDGKLDLAVRNQSSNSVSILLGNGDGTFRAARGYATGGGVSRMVAGDFNGDGKLDLATTNANDGTVSILLGNGDGTFQNHVDYPVGPDPLAIATGDINGDGKLDLVVAASSGDTYSILMGKGDGTFEKYASYPTIENPQSVVLADFNGDGKLDLAVFAEISGDGLAILLGNGDGTFRSPTLYEAGCGADGTDCTAAAADFNGDGFLDLAVRTNPSDQVSVLLGNGDGTFQNPLLFPVGAEPEQVAVGDFNGDGRLDLAVANLSGGNVTLLMQVTGSKATVAPASLNFGSQLRFTPSAPQTVTLSNTGAETLEISGIATSSNFLQTNNCGSSLAPGGQCQIQVVFNPLNICGIAGTLTITDSASNSPQTVALSGVGTIVSVSPTNVNFGNQTVGTTGAAQTVTITNHGKRVLNIQGIEIIGKNRLGFAQTNTCGTSVAAGLSCTVSITFTANFKGPKTATLYIQDDGGDAPQEIALSGNGT